MPSWLLATNNFFLPFRMPLLMFLSGMLVDRSLAKPLATYYLGKVRLLLWPYLLFAALHITLYGRGLELTNPWSFIATGYLWFLFFVAACYLSAPLLTRVPPLLVVVACAIAAPVLEGAWGLGHRFSYYALFFFLGQLASRRWESIAWLFRRPSLWVAGFSACAFGLISAASEVDAFQRDIRYAPLSIAGIVVAVALARRLPDIRAVRATEAIGRHSIVYYAAHFPIMLVTTTAALAVNVNDPLVLMPVNLVLAGGGSALVMRLRSRPPVRWVFEMPLPRCRRQGSGTYRKPVMTK